MTRRGTYGSEWAASQLNWAVDRPRLNRFREGFMPLPCRRARAFALLAVIAVVVAPQSAAAQRYLSPVGVRRPALMVPAVRVLDAATLVGSRLSDPPGRRANIGRRAVIGALVGGLAGAGLAYLATRTVRNPDTNVVAFVYGVPAGAALGAAVGALSARGASR